MKKTIIVLIVTALANCLAAVSKSFDLFTPLVNQAGYNLYEAKRFVCYGAEDGTPFWVINNSTGKRVFKGKIKNNQGWFSKYNPHTTDEFIIEVKGKGRSVPFWIADHLMEKISTKLAYDFFVDVRGSTDPIHSNEPEVFGGGPSRDQGAYGLEALFEVLLYSSNPAVFDNWTTELGDKNTADLIDLILWHGEFAYHHVDYHGAIGYRHGDLGYKDQPRMAYDYWNTLDQLAPICAAYHTFLRPYLSKEKYQAYRQACLDHWEEYDRHKVVRYWTRSDKWVDQGFQEFNEMGNAFGQSVFSNLFMYLCEKNEPNGNPAKFLKYAQESAQDIIDHWDLNNPRHTWWIRNAEHITPQALAFFLLVAPDKAPQGTKEKLSAWAEYIRSRCHNSWQYRSHSDKEMAHPVTKELGGAPALGGSLFAAAQVLGDAKLRDLGWAQVDFVFGINPVGTHLSNKSQVRININGYWEGVEKGWPISHPWGFGQLGRCRGTLDGTPLNGQFPEMQDNNDTVIPKYKIKGGSYSTEGWGISNRGWMSTVTFMTLGDTKLIITNPHGKNITKAKPGETVVVELKAGLNVDWTKKDKGWVEAYIENGQSERVLLEETDSNSGIFKGQYRIPIQTSSHTLTFSYGYFGLGNQRILTII